MVFTLCANIISIFSYRRDFVQKVFFGVSFSHIGVSYLVQDLYFRNCLALLILFIMNCFLVVIPENHLKLSHEYFKTLASSGGFFHHLSESSEPQATLQSFFSTIE